MDELALFVVNHFSFYLFLLFCLLGNGIVFFIVRRKSHPSRSIAHSSVLGLVIVIGDLLTSTSILAFKVGSVPIVLKCLLSVCSGALIYLAARTLCDLVMSFTKSIKRINCVGAGTFIYFLISLLIYRQSEISYWGVLWYAADYSIGMGSRFLLGTILRFLSGGFLYYQLVIAFCYAFLFILVILISALANKMYSACEENYRFAFLYIWVLFLAGPGSLDSYWSSSNLFGRLEIYGLIISVGCLLIYNRWGINKISFAVITVLSVLSMAIYQGNIFMYYQLIMMIFLWEIYNSPHSISKWVYGVLNFCLTSCAFLLFQFGSRVSFESAEQMGEYIGRNTNVPISVETLDNEFFRSITDIYSVSNVNYYNNIFPRESTIVTLIVLFPLIVLFIGLYSKCFRYFKSKNPDKSIMKSVYPYFLALLIIIIPQFLLNVDWGRWMISEYAVLFIGFLFLLWKKDGGAVEACTSLNQWITRHWFISLLVLIYLAGLDKFDHYFFIRQVVSVMQWLVDNGWVIR